MKKTLAIDFGTKRIGLAISRASLADPLKIVPNNSQSITNIKKICDLENIEQILVGISENEMAKKTKQFATKLKKLRLKIIFFDETLSSNKVREKISSSHMKQSKRRKPIDHFAATQFLQEWIDIQ